MSFSCVELVQTAPITCAIQLFVDRGWIHLIVGQSPRSIFLPHTRSTVICHINLEFFNQICGHTLIQNVTFVLLLKFLKCRAIYNL